MSDVSDAAGKSAQIWYAMYDEARNNLAPYRQMGQNVTPYYGGILGVPGYDKVDPTQALEATPGYQWQMDQGVNAIDRSAAAKGMLGSGAVAQGLLKYGQGLASNTYGSYMDRLYNLLNLGQNTAMNQGQLGMNMASGVGNTLTNAAQFDQTLEAQQNQNQNGFGLNSLMSGVGLLGGLALSPTPAGGLGKTMLGSAMGWK